MFHYHAVFSCGHKLGFDVNHDLLGTAIKEGADDATVRLPCRSCKGKERESLPGTLMPGGENIHFCVTCKKGFGDN